MKGFLKSDFAKSIYIGLSYILLWLPLIFISAYNNTERAAELYAYSTWQNGFIFFTCLVLFHVLLPAVRASKKKATWVLVSVATMLALLTYGYIKWLSLGMFFGAYPKSEGSMVNSSYVVRTVTYQLYGISYFAVFKLLFHNINLKNKNQQLEIEKNKSQLNYLKSQTNPHFLFNTLNNIYALARDKSDFTADCVLRLSDILRYMLYGTQAPFVTIEKELFIIEEYIELEKMRYDNSLTISFKKDIDNALQEIPPLLLIPLVENAFKHGAAETIASPFIDITISIQNNKLLCSVCNSIDVDDPPLPPKENIGLTNLRQQLKLMYADYHLAVHRGATAAASNNLSAVLEQPVFTTTLTINLASYV